MADSSVLSSSLEEVVMTKVLVEVSVFQRESDRWSGVRAPIETYLVDVDDLDDAKEEAVRQARRAGGNFLLLKAGEVSFPWTS